MDNVEKNEKTNAKETKNKLSKENTNELKQKKENENVKKQEVENKGKKEIESKDKTTKNEKKKGKHIVLKFILICIIILLIMLIAFSISYYFYNKNQAKIDKDQNQKLSQILKEENKEFEYGSEISYDDLKKSVIDISKLNDQISYQIEINDKIQNDEANYKFMQIGENKIKTTIKTRDESKKVLKISTDCTNIKSFFKYFKITYAPKEYISTKINKYNVVDTQKPIIDGVSDKEIYVGNDIDLKQGIKATDPIDGELEVNIEGEVDKNKVGEYNIKVSAKDKNNNETTKEFKVIVKEEPKKQIATIKSTSSNSKATTSSSNTSSNSSSNKTSTTKRRYSSYIINKYYKNCTDDQIDQAEAIAKSIASKAKSSSSKPVEQIDYAAKRVYEYWLKCSYDTTYSNPYYRSPYGVFCAKICTCSGITRALGRVLDYMGYSWTHANENQYTHQWNEVTVNGQKIWADGMAGCAGTGKYL